MAGLPNNVSESVRRLNPQLFGPSEPVQHNVPTVVKARKVIRVTSSQEERLNKTEKRFLEYLRAKYTDRQCRIGIQDHTLRIGADCRYTPDFSLWLGFNGGTMTFFDVKGPHTWEDAKVKLKATATQFSMYKFNIAIEDDGQWQILEVPA